MTNSKLISPLFANHNSYFPNTYIYARPLPNHPTKVIGIVGGHHGITRSGRLIIADPSVGRSEADGEETRWKKPSASYKGGVLERRKFV